MPATVPPTAPTPAPPANYALATLRIRGVDARKFLQGQLSNDIEQLKADRLLCAGLHNPQGRVLAVLWLASTASNEVAALLPAELAPAISTALMRYVLRAKVRIEVTPEDAALGALLGAPAATAAAKLLDIARGIPQVYAASSGQFIAQMLNLDCIDAISFNKGCYTGQEVIARAHYRGRVKRRMQRFLSAAPLTLTPGAALRLGDGRNAQLVESVALADGRCEFLAVAPLPGAARAPDPTALASPGAPLIQCKQLPLPYALPD
jgi:tRNA-modifying protein YgfZ